MRRIEVTFETSSQLHGECTFFANQPWAYWPENGRQTFGEGQLAEFRGALIWKSGAAFVQRRNSEDYTADLHLLRGHNI